MTKHKFIIRISDISPNPKFGVMYFSVFAEDEISALEEAYKLFPSTFDFLFRFVRLYQEADLICLQMLH